jgi:hypothetical protein
MELIQLAINVVGFLICLGIFLHLYIYRFIFVPWRENNFQLRIYHLLAAMVGVALIAWICYGLKHWSDMFQLLLLLVFTIAGFEWFDLIVNRCRHSNWQFGVKHLLWAMVLVSVVFGCARWITH